MQSRIYHAQPAPAVYRNRVTRDPDCLFCQIAGGETGTSLLWQDDRVAAFTDVRPQAPTHVLVVPKDHHRDIGALAAADADGTAALMRAISVVARELGVGAGYRVVFNTGAEAGQTVFHCHAHVLGGRALTWPPG